MKEFNENLYGDDLQNEVFNRPKGKGDFLGVTKESVYEQDRWKNYYSQVFKYGPDNTFWEASWARGATEYQDVGIEDFILVQVTPKQVTTTIYEMVE